MFDAIGVSDRTRKPWTVATSLLAQALLIGVGIVVPLLSTEVLPHRLGWVGVPEPPRARGATPVQRHAMRSAAPTQIYRRMLIEPAAIPPKAAMIQDQPEVLPASVESGGVPGGIPGAEGAGHGGIDSLIPRTTAVAPPPPPPPPRHEESKPVKRITVGGNVQSARLLSGPAPVYPPLARQARIAGVVRLEAVIARDGSIMHLRAISGHPLLIPAAVAAVSQWVFRPTYLNGEPVEVATQIDVNFTLQN